MRELNNKEVASISGAYSFGDFTKAALSGLGKLFENIFKGGNPAWPRVIEKESGLIPLLDKQSKQ
jgi:hypothetical protein